jgi:protease-4
MILAALQIGCIFLPSLDFKEKLEEKFVYGNEKSSNKILFLPLEGVIMSQESKSMLSSRNITTPEEVNELLKQAEKDKAIKAIILTINSPGGAVTASDIIYRTIKEFKEKNPDKKIIALLQDTAASGGYYVACACDYVLAHPTTITGSIGVISLFIIAEDLMGKIGVETTVIKSGSAKDSGSPFRKMTEQEKQIFQQIIDQLFNRFVNIVHQARKEQLTKEGVLSLADGRVFTGEEALSLKLVDAVGYLSDGYKKTLEFSSLKDARVIKYHKKGGLGGLFNLSLPQSELGNLSDFILKDAHSRFMYLWMPSLTSLKAE